VYDEAAYYHTQKIEDAAEAIHQNGLLMGALGDKLRATIGGDVTIVSGGETTIKPIKRRSDTPDDLSA
jgi:hypothetical protein